MSSSATVAIPTCTKGGATALNVQGECLGLHLRLGRLVALRLCIIIGVSHHFEHIVGYGFFTVHPNRELIPVSYSVCTPLPVMPPCLTLHAARTPTIVFLPSVIPSNLCLCKFRHRCVCCGFRKVAPFLSMVELFYMLQHCCSVCVCSLNSKPVCTSS
jgi:hypothetical protein